MSSTTTPGFDQLMKEHRERADALAEVMREDGHEVQTLDFMDYLNLVGVEAILVPTEKAIAWAARDAADSGS
jgi:hypothetical protein